MSDDTTTTEAEEVTDLDELVAEVCEHFGGAANALAEFQEKRAEEASELGVHPEQLPEDRREFQLRRKLEIRAAQENKATAHEAAVDQRRGQRLSEIEAADIHNRRNKLADLASRAELEERALARPTHGGEGEAEYTEKVLAEYDDDAKEHAEEVAEDKAQHEDDVAKGKAEAEALAQRRADAGGEGQRDNPDGTRGMLGSTKGLAEPNVVKDKMARPENLDGLNVGALKALAKKHGLTVERSDGEPGAPRREDYVAALSA